MNGFWKIFYVTMAVAGVAIIAIAIFGTNQAIAPTATVAVPAAPVEAPRRPRFNVN